MSLVSAGDVAGTESSYAVPLIVSDFYGGCACCSVRCHVEGCSVWSWYLMSDCVDPGLCVEFEIAAEGAGVPCSCHSDWCGERLLVRLLCSGFDVCVDVSLCVAESMSEAEGSGLTWWAASLFEGAVLRVAGAVCGVLYRLLCRLWLCLWRRRL